MLIRVADHFKMNPKRIDKLIAIKGLPDEWLYRDTPEGRELKKPWAADVDANIPHDIRHLCEPMYINFRYSPITKGEKEIIDRRQVLGIKIDYNTEPGREMWDQVERYLEESIPRNERIPIPVVCAKDERSAFETYKPRRNAGGSLEFVPSPVPEIDLTKYRVVEQELAPVQTRQTPVAAIVVPPVETVLPQPPSTKEPQATLFKCEDCDYEHRSKQGVRMHRVTRHPKKEKVSV